MRISRARSKMDNRPTTLEVDWDGLTALLRAVEETDCNPCPSLDPTQDKCSKREGACWFPVVFDGVPDQKPDGTQGGWKSLRHVVSYEVLVYDVDHVTRAQLEAIDAKVTAAGLACIMYGTHSNDPAHNDWSVRVVFPLSAPIQVNRNGQRQDDRLRRFRAVIAERLAIPPDPATKDESRTYFLPTVPRGTPYVFGLTKGGSIDVTELDRLPIDEAESTRGDSGSRGAEASGERDATASAPVSPPGAVDLGDLRKRAIEGAAPHVKAAVRLAMKGELMATDDSGQRDNTLNLVMSSLAFSLPWGTPVEAILELVRESCNAWRPRKDSDGRTWWGQAEFQLTRALKRREPEALQAIEDAAIAQMYNPDREDRTAAGGRVISKYTADEMAAFCLNQSVTDPHDFRRRWVIRHMGANWIFVNGRYCRPLKDVDLQWSLARDLERAPIELKNVDKKGTETPKHFKEILDNYSTVARGVQGSLSAKFSTYDPAEETFHEAICPPRALSAEFNPDIDHWLRLFGNDAVLDWVAAVSQLQHQCAAIYLKGEKGVGKTLFANGLARIWRAGGPTKFESVMGVSFNSSMADCPLIFADESLPRTPTIINDLRALIGSDTHDLNRKFMPTVSVRGAIRLIIAGNNEHLLNTPARLEASDVDAMAARILYVDMTDNRRPAEFINALKADKTKGEKAYVDSWVYGDLMAKHALWLAQNRPLNLNERFLVTGAPEFADRLNTESGNVPAVFEFLARFLSDARQQPTKLLKTGQGRLLVSTELLADKNQFETFVPSRRVLSAQETSQALRQVRDHVEHVDGKDFHAVKVPLFMWWAQHHQVGDLPTIKARIHATH